MTRTDDKRDRRVVAAVVTALAGLVGLIAT